ncbi:S9 family peptidase [Marivirga arenosa]|uniref:Prolyl oligopeptidase family serine peptidase n=1 Tax=Marivirga arenosa TaxID=3059076 RepID=A0AA51ZXG4_9BACT|nr:prolyl oligopeptidase family serine peptidase [Marivirga sp. BKB1-2]WNB18523.1 prolyl oligopeptidase family serine peptidase [Marivirga sp. BKB1-2]
MMNSKSTLLIIIFLLVICIGIMAQNSIDYQQPVEGIQRILESEPNPEINLSPDGKYVAICTYDRFNKGPKRGTILNLAGVSFNTLTNMPGSGSYYRDIKIKEATSDSTELSFSGLPNNIEIVNYKWSPDSKYIAAAIKENDRISLWLLTVDSRTAKMLYNGALNFSLIRENIFEWLPTENAIVFTAVSERNPDLLSLPDAKPKVFENKNSSEPSRTYQGLLESEHDEKLFEYYGISQLKKVNVVSGRITKLNSPGGILNFQPSPDGRYIMVHLVKKPFSYEYTVHRFPSELILLNNSGKLIERIEVPRVVRPLGRDAAYNVKRNFSWRNDKNATLTWVQSLDNGDPNEKVEKRDALYSWHAPFNETPSIVFSTALRFNEAIWVNDTLAIIKEKWWKTRTVNWLLINPQTSQLIDTVGHYNSQSILESLGDPIEIQQNGINTLLFRDSSLLLSRVYLNEEKEVVPFLETRNLFTGKTEILWESKAPNYEFPVTMINDENLNILFIARQSANVPINLVRYEIETKNNEQITFNENNLEIFNSELAQKNLFYYRKDSVKLEAEMLYNKDSLKNGGIKGAIVFAYPIDYINSSSANEHDYYPYKFRANLSLQKLLALSGYLVFDNTSFPIIATEGKPANDSYLQQIDMNSKAVIDALKETKIVDTNQVAIMGHSYGAFMVANVLTHSNYFRTGIAISGAYNRTLTPFGFQREYRTYWEDPKMYNKISPFQNADQLKNSILLFHGENDQNPGTHYQQSERYFEALKGLGKEVRFVSLPNEEHQFILSSTYSHIIWEIDRWLINQFNSVSVDGYAPKVMSE